MRKRKTAYELAILRSVLGRMRCMQSDLVIGRAASLSMRMGAIIRDLSIEIDTAEEVHEQSSK